MRRVLSVLPRSQTGHSLSNFEKVATIASCFQRLGIIEFGSADLNINETNIQEFSIISPSFLTIQPGTSFICVVDNCMVA